MGTKDFRIGENTTARIDADNDQIVVSTSADVGTSLDANKARQQTPINRKSEFRMVASIDPVIYLKIMNEKGIDLMNRDHWPAFKKLLNDPDYKYLKCINGKV